MRLPAVLFAVSLVACMPRRATPGGAEAGVPPEPVTKAASAAAVNVDSLPSAELPSQHFAYMQMTKDVLSVCMDVDTVGQFDAGPGGLDAKTMKAQGLTQIKKTCEKQLADRTPLATCAVVASGDAGASASMTMRYYSFESVGLNDKEMKDCLGMKGDWTPVPRDSMAWTTAKLEYHQRQLHGAMQQAGVGQ